MTLEKAIEILSDSAYTGLTTFNQDFKDAQKLGIEALKRLESWRSYFPNYPFTLLPGEREDNKPKLRIMDSPKILRLKGGQK